MIEGITVEIRLYLNQVIIKIGFVKISETTKARLRGKCIALNAKLEQKD